MISGSFCFHCCVSKTILGSTNICPPNSPPCLSALTVCSRMPLRHFFFFFLKAPLFFANRGQTRASVCFRTTEPNNITTIFHPPVWTGRSSPVSLSGGLLRRSRRSVGLLCQKDKHRVSAWVDETADCQWIVKLGWWTDGLVSARAFDSKPDWRMRRVGGGGYRPVNDTDQINFSFLY